VPTTCTLEDLERLTASGHKFQTIYVDPPWKYRNRASRGAAEKHYNTMTVEEIAALPVGRLAGEKGHLWLWTTNAFLFKCPRLFEAWGFEFKSTCIWVKPQMGCGNYLRNSHEILLLAVRGGLAGRAKDVMSWLEIDRGKHSSKPVEFRQLIEKVSPGPYLELFARDPALGWTVWGNEIDRDVFEAGLSVG
jgi:N6-adenosine-specific RNA methylase IME4